MNIFCVGISQSSASTRAGERGGRTGAFASWFQGLRLFWAARFASVGVYLVIYHYLTTPIMGASLPERLPQGESPRRSGSALVLRRKWDEAGCGGML